MSTASANQSRAYISHTSSSLKDSRVLWPSNGRLVHSIGMQNGELVVVTHALGASYEGREVEEVLAGFCQRIFLLFQVDTRALGIAGVIAEQLFKSIDDNGSFSRETMPLGIQGVQELNWTTQNEELVALQQQYQRRVQDEGKPLKPFSMTDSNGNELLFAGLGEETLVIVDKAMLAVGIVRYRVHFFDVGLGRPKNSWQLFVKINHQDFLRSWFRSSLAPVQDMAVAVMTAMRIFSDARRLINEPGRRTEAVVLVETIRRGQFYMNSTVVDEGTAAAPETLAPSDGDVSAKDSHSQPDPSLSPSSSSSSPSSNSSSPPTTMGEPSISDPAGTVQATSTKKRKKRPTRKNRQKKQDSQCETPSNEGTESSRDKSLQDIVSGTADITISEPPAIPTSASAPTESAVQPDGGSSEKGTSAAAPPTTAEVKQKDNDGNPSKTRTAGGRDQDLDDTASRHSSDSDRTIIQADFSTKDVAVSPSSKGQQGNEVVVGGGGVGGGGAVVADSKEDSENKADENTKTTSGTQSTASDDGDSEPSEHVKPVDQEPRHPSAGFKFDGFDPRLRCLKPDCRNMTSCWDCAVMICPACGTDSFTRYCRKQHLYDDIQRHWAVECGRNKINGPIDRDTIRPRQIPKRPYIFGQYHDIVERHRQAVYRAMEDADYFIFNDVKMLDSGIVHPTQEQWNSVRGTGEAVFQIVFPDDMTPHSDRQIFNYHIQRILSLGKPLAEESCVRALEMIRSALVMTGSWTVEILSYLCMQLPGEWGNFKIPERFYNVIEVNAMWQMHRALPMADR
ncbi:uncharacterized protein Z520_07318 [Fonsecaea multimorphosa CBS 102226]|uniref:Uncharacterized protein n=1 Tax=Fonsecaea multimorphosa CBS 102226 TaxID=1442371 RepID=A0A0D2K2C2_9EURO|nr:uncharacterized protein Z520_07318 [Fonsecaea multimorphosa CBS 102226]KIX97204.1 hypothetical protein Z520_07318 [Fonsecaea multimorphosa CBS 102226]